MIFVTHCCHFQVPHIYAAILNTEPNSALSKAMLFPCDATYRSKVVTEATRFVSSDSAHSPSLHLAFAITTFKPFGFMSALVATSKLTYVVMFTTL